MGSMVWPEGGEFGAKCSGGSGCGRGKCTNQHINCLWCAGEVRWEQRLEATAHLVANNCSLVHCLCYHHGGSAGGVRTGGYHQLYNSALLPRAGAQHPQNIPFAVETVRAREHG